MAKEWSVWTHGRAQRRAGGIRENVRGRRVITPLINFFGFIMGFPFVPHQRGGQCFLDNVLYFEKGGKKTSRQPTNGWGEPTKAKNKRLIATFRQGFLFLSSFFFGLTCLDSCSSHSLYSVKNLRASSTLSMKPQLANFTLMMIWRSGTIMATQRKLIFRFSGSSWRPA